MAVRRGVPRAWPTRCLELGHPGHRRQRQLLQPDRRRRRSTRPRSSACSASIDDVARRMPFGWQAPGENSTCSARPATSWAARRGRTHVHGHLGGRPPRSTSRAEQRLGAAAGRRGARRACCAPRTTSATAASPRRWSSWRISGRIGCRCGCRDGLDPFVALFSESVARAVVAVDRAELDGFLATSASTGVPAVVLGEVGRGQPRHRGALRRAGRGPRRGVGGDAAGPVQLTGHRLVAAPARDDHGQRPERLSPGGHLSANPTRPSSAAARRRASRAAPAARSLPRVRHLGAPGRGAGHRAARTVPARRRVRRKRRRRQRCAGQTRRRCPAAAARPPQGPDPAGAEKHAARREGAVAGPIAVTMWHRPTPARAEVITQRSWAPSAASALMVSDVESKAAGCRRPRPSSRRSAGRVRRRRTPGPTTAPVRASTVPVVWREESGRLVANQHLRPGRAALWLFSYARKRPARVRPAEALPSTLPRLRAPYSPPTPHPHPAFINSCAPTS